MYPSHSHRVVVYEVTYNTVTGQRAKEIGREEKSRASGVRAAHGVRLFPTAMSDEQLRVFSLNCWYAFLTTHIFTKIDRVYSGA